ncbi:hypothetical protein FQR65_LT18288 [Abscondita terminalis]|nr:hypothetical protein FQR65_LT18288 [Abscondita terminalis]
MLRSVRPWRGRAAGHVAASGQSSAATPRQRAAVPWYWPYRCGAGTRSCGRVISRSETARGGVLLEERPVEQRQALGKIHAPHSFDASPALFQQHAASAGWGSGGVACGSRASPARHGLAFQHRSPLLAHHDGVSTTVRRLPLGEFSGHFIHLFEIVSEYHS